MVTRFYLDTRRHSGDVPAPLKLSIAHNNKVAYLSLGIKIRKSEWNDRTLTAKSIAINHTIQQRKRDIEEHIYNRIRTHAYDGMSATDIRDDIKRSFSSTSHSGAVQKCFELIIQGKSEGTKSLYRYCIKCLREYTDFERLEFGQIDLSFIEGFDLMLTESGKKVNTISAVHRKLKSVINFAIKHDYTTHNPYIKFKLKREQTKHRTFTLDQIKSIRDADVPSSDQQYIDIFMLIFYLIGINAADLFNARIDDVRNGRLEYHRRKTNKLYSILIPDEAWEIIKKYPSRSGRLIGMCDNLENYQSYTKKANCHLQSLFPDYPHISTYWARHSWATIAYRVGVPKYDISLALGHSIGSIVTDIYIEYDNDVVDRANQLVLNALKG